MRVITKTLLNREIPIDIEANQTVKDMIRKLYYILGIEPKCIRLIYRGQQLEEHNSIDELGVQENDVMQIITRIIH